MRYLVNRNTEIVTTLNGTKQTMKVGDIRRSIMGPIGLNIRNMLSKHGSYTLILEPIIDFSVYIIEPRVDLFTEMTSFYVERGGGYITAFNGFDEFSNCIRSYALLSEKTYSEKDLNKILACAEEALSKPGTMHIISDFNITVSVKLNLKS